jgi:hypothetical protein
MATIRFEAKLFMIDSWILLRLPKSASAKLPSRGMTMVEGTINDFRFQAALEPDGKGSHWFKLDKPMRKSVGAEAGDTVTLEVEPVKEWSEPNIPADLKKALAVTPKAHTLWMNITPMARWEWIRWMRARNIGDVDNGPAAFTASHNAGLYDDRGLASARQALKAGGVLAVWSAREDRRFEQRLRYGGFTVEVERVRGRLKKGGPRHTIFLGHNTAGAPHG